MESTDRPKVSFSGENGNIFNLIAIARTALRAHGKGEEAKEIFSAVTRAQSYEEALEILGKYVDFE